jgi:hypothetical protein
MAGGVSIPADIVSAIYPNLLRHACKGMGMDQQCFHHLPFTIPYQPMPGDVSIPTEIVLEIYGDCPQQAGNGMGMHQKCFSHLPFPTNTCQEVYPYLPKLFRQFTLAYQGMLAKVWRCAKTVLVIYRS